MSVTIAQILNEARDAHPSLAAAVTPPPLAIRAVSRFVRDLYETIATKVPGFLIQSTTIAMPIPVFANGVNLTTQISGGWKDLLDLSFGANDGSGLTYIKGRALPYEQRDMSCGPAWTFAGNVIYFVGSESSYNQFSSALLTYTPMPPQFTALTDTIPAPLPDDCLDCLAAMLAAFLAGRLVDDPNFVVSAQTWAVLGTIAGTQRKAFLTRIFRLSQRQDYVIRDVMGTGSARPVL